MTLEEFLESGLDGYEYVQGELIQMPATSVEHGLIGANRHTFLRGNSISSVASKMNFCAICLHCGDMLFERISVEAVIPKV